MKRFIIFCFLVFYSDLALSQEIEFQDYNFLSDKRPYNKIKDIADVLADNKNETDEAMIMHIFVSQYDLNDDGINEILISFDARSTICGMSANCAKKIYQKEGEGFNLILDVAATSSIKVLKTRSDGFYDLKLGGRGFKYPIWSFDGLKYNLHKMTDRY